MAGKWTVQPLEDCMAAIIDYRGKTPQKTSFGIPLITAKIVKGGKIETPDEFISVNDYEPWMRRGLPKAGDVIITTEAPLGEVAQLGAERVALAQRLIALRGKSGVLDNGFLKFLMQSDDVQEQLRARATGTTVLGIKQSELRKVLLALPSIEEQRAIAYILGTLDDKIELNRRMNATLEAMARALFKSWFVDFDPVRTKAEGRDTGLPPDLAALFPDRLVESGVGEVPEGWEVGHLRDAAFLVRDTVSPMQTPEEVFLHYSIPAFDDSQTPKKEAGAEIRSQKFRVPSDAVLVSKLNPEIERVWLVDASNAGHAICSTEFLVFQAREPYTRCFVCLLARSTSFRRELQGLVTGTSKSHQRAQPESVLSMATVLPSAKAVESFEKSVAPLLEATQARQRESRTLAALRDALLPKLLSGEVRAADWERINEGCA